jgi:hypothetical protein
VDFAGELETHLTVDVTSSDDVAALRAWAAGRGLKFTHIVLARGRTPSQPMLTRHGRGTLAAELAASAELTRALRDAGFVVSRVKVEAAPWNASVPKTDDEGARHPPQRYFEHHVKLLLAAEADIAPITAIAARHVAHVSRNALRRRDDGRQERFVTQRCRGVGRETAHARLEAMLSDLAAGGYGGDAAIDVEEEFVVHDTTVAIDAGWIDADGEARA